MAVSKKSHGLVLGRLGAKREIRYLSPNLTPEAGGAAPVWCLLFFPLPPLTTLSSAPLFTTETEGQITLVFTLRTCLDIST